MVRFKPPKMGHARYLYKRLKQGLCLHLNEFLSPQNRPDKRLVVTADSAYAKISDDARLFLILENGRQYFLDANKQQISSMRFGQYGISMSDVANVEARNQRNPSRSVTNTDLV